MTHDSGWTVQNELRHRFHGSRHNQFTLPFSFAVPRPRCHRSWRTPLRRSAADPAASSQTPAASSRGSERWSPGSAPPPLTTNSSYFHLFFSSTFGVSGDMAGEASLPATSFNSTSAIFAATAWTDIAANRTMLFFSNRENRYTNG